VKYLLPLCPYCKEPLLDLSEVTTQDDKLLQLGFISIGCCNPYCKEQPSYYIRVYKNPHNDNSQKEQYK